MSTDFVLVEVLGSHERVASRTGVALSDNRRSFVIGRSALADIVLDDEYVAARHVELQVSPAGEVLANDLDTLNGIKIAGTLYRGAGHRVAPGSELLVGRTRLRIRTADESLAPERRDDEARGVVQRNPAWAAGIGVALCILLIAYTSWLGAPREVSPIFVYASMAFLAAAGTWIALWGLITRVTLGEWRWVRHAAVIFCVAALFYFCEMVLEFAGFVVALPHWEAQDILLTGVMAALALYGHLTVAAHLGRRRAMATAALLPALAVATFLWLQSRNQVLNVNRIAERAAVYPPSLRLSTAKPLDAFFERSTALKDAAHRKRDAMPREGAEGESEWSGD